MRRDVKRSILDEQVAATRIEWGWCLGTLRVVSDVTDKKGSELMKVIFFLLSNPHNVLFHSLSHLADKRACAGLWL